MKIFVLFVDVVVNALFWADLDESLTLPGIHPFYVRLLPRIRSGDIVDMTLHVDADGNEEPL